MSKNFLTACALSLPALVAYAEEVRWPVPPAGYSAASASIPKGTLSNSISYPTRKQGNRVFKIYTPPGYSATRAEKYPVLYLHHGIGGNESAWTSSASGQAEGNADKVMDFLYAQSNLNVTPMIVVMPYGNVVNSTTGDAWASHEDVLINDLAPYIEKTYNASTSPTMRAIAGLSMGGGQTLNFGYKNPTFFNWIGAFSPAPNTTRAEQTMNTPTLIAAVKSNVKLNFLAGGTTESDYLNRARTYHNWLNSNGVTNLYLQVEQGLNHERENWNRQLHNFAQRIFKGVPTEIIQSPKKAVARSVDYRTTSKFLVGWNGSAGASIFTLDGRTVSARNTPSFPSSQP